MKKKELKNSEKSSVKSSVPAVIPMEYEVVEYDFGGVVSMVSRSTTAVAAVYSFSAEILNVSPRAKAKAKEKKKHGGK